jgi:Permuted papain-like amidase enzyme, YaeF/YiiX, C92 family
MVAQSCVRARVGFFCAPSVLVLEELRSWRGDIFESRRKGQPALQRVAAPPDDTISSYSNLISRMEVSPDLDRARDGARRRGAIARKHTWRLTMFWFCFWMISLASYDRGVAEATDWLRPPGWSGNYWGPAALRARLAGELPPLPINSAMVQWARWGRKMLREGDIVFRTGDARICRGIVPVSFFIAKATGSPFSHTGIVAIEDGSPVVYDCSSEGVQRQPFEVWMLDCVGALGVKRLKPEHRRHIPGVIAHCRAAFEKEIPFDYGFRPDDRELYCLELTEKAFRSQGLTLSNPVRIGDWELLGNYPLTALLIPYCTSLVLDEPISLEQAVYLPGNDHHGVWASPLLETVYGPKPKGNQDAAPAQPGSFSVRGDLEMIVFTVHELGRSYSELPVRWMCDLTLRARPPAVAMRDSAATSIVRAEGKER